MKRNETKQVFVGTLPLGGNQHVYIQSMTNTKTSNVVATVAQILALERAGCEIIRVAILNMDDALAIGTIKKQIHIPLVCDIHFDYRLALACMEQGCDKIRINPGNIGSPAEVKLICDKAKEKGIPIRVGVNSGSLPKGMAPTAENMILAAKQHVDILEKHDFTDIILALKASSVPLAVQAYTLASETFSYPLHIGITESGTTYGGLIKSSIGIGHLLLQGIGNTIRVSLSDDPIEEIYAAKAILSNCGLKHTYQLTSCPTCGRIQYDMLPIAKEIESFLRAVDKPIHVAIMGCAVNGPGEAREADLGIAGGNGEALLFKKGKIIKKLPESEILNVLKEEILLF